MNILFISDVFFPRVNGVSTSINTFAQELKNLGEFVYVLDGDSLRFSQSENSKKGIILSQLESSLNKILNNAGLQYKLRYEYSK